MFRIGAVKSGLRGDSQATRNHEVASLSPHSHRHNSCLASCVRVDIRLEGSDWRPVRRHALPSLRRSNISPGRNIANKQ
jgi:hypothetical protein